MAYTLVPTELIVDGAVTSAKLDTNIAISGTLGVTGELTLSTHMNMGDNDKIKIGTGGDLEIYHDGSNSYISNSTGNIYLADTNGSVHIQAKLNEESIVCTADGSVSLYYDNAVKLATSSAGIDVTGTATMDGLTVEGDTLSMSHTGNTSTISLTQKAGTQNSVATISANREDTSSSASRLLLSTNNGTSTLQRIRIGNGGDISFYEDTGTTAKFFWDASAESLGIGTTSPDRTIKIHKDNSYVWIADAAGGNVAFIGGSGENDGLMRLYEGVGHTAKVEIHSDANSYFNGGNVGIGTDSPNAELDVASTSPELRLTDSTDNSYTRLRYEGAAFLIEVDDASGANGSNFRIQVDGTEAMRIDSSGNVGIGDTSPSSITSLVSTLSLNGTDAGTSGGLAYKVNGTIKGYHYVSSNFLLHQAVVGVGHRFLANNTEAMRIDSSGNLLVGTTTIIPSNSSTEEGISLATGSYGGFLSVSRNGGTAAAFNRMSSDGQILDFRKDGSAVGSIGTTGGQLSIGKDDTGLLINASSDNIYPWNTTTGAIRDAAIDLGKSNTRFKDLYLSSKVNLGDTNRNLMYRSANNDVLLEAASGLFYRQDIGNTNHSWFTGNSERMRIASNGRTSIGTTTTNAGLTVANADIRCTGPAVANDANSISLSQESSGGFITARGANTSTRGTISLNVSLSTGGSGIVGLKVENTGNVTIAGALSKGSGSFKIDHPLESKKDTHHLVHSFVEAPQADNIYRGVVTLVDGSATINLDTEAGMTEGTFVLLNTNTSCFTSNESDWDAVKGSVLGNILTISCQNTSSTATVSWLVIGERHDQHMIDTDWTDENGKVIVEPLKGETE